MTDFKCKRNEIIDDFLESLLAQSPNIVINNRYNCITKKGQTMGSLFINIKRNNTNELLPVKYMLRWLNYQPFLRHIHLN